MGKSRAAESSGGPRLDGVIHERARLMILTYLASTPESAVSFPQLKERLELSAGNLSIQLRNLEQAGYVKIVKSFVGNKPNTSVSLTTLGDRALSEYLGEMEELIRQLKGGREGGATSGSSGRGRR